MSRFDLDSYEPVEDRLAKFWVKHPSGRVLTDVVSYGEREYIVRAEAYRDAEDTRPAATGYAHELVGSSAVNKTSALENCETSAVGRALANLGFAPKGARASREEMAKAQRHEEPEGPTDAQVEEFGRFRTEIQVASLVGLDALVGEIQQAHKAHRITDPQNRRLADLWQRRRAELDAKAATAEEAKPDAD